jgi:hypothetical protein
MPRPQTSTGRYTRPDDGITFDYSVTVARAEQGTVWFSRVTIADALRGRPSGMLKHKRLHDPEIEAAVRELVERAIRERAGVA